MGHHVWGRTMSIRKLRARCQKTLPTFFQCLFIFLFAGSCTKSDYPKHVGMHFLLPESWQAAAGQSLNEFSCLLVNVRGPGVDFTFGPGTLPHGITSECVQLGTVSVARSMTAAQTAGIPLKVRVGPERTFEVLGVVTPAGVPCDGKPLPELLQNAGTQLKLVGSATQDVNLDTMIEIQNTYIAGSTSSMDRLPECRTNGGGGGGQASGITITTVSPSIGSASGGTVVTLSGTGFSDISQVKFGGATCAMSAQTDTSYVCNTPTHLPGIVDVVAYNSSGVTETAVGAFNFKFGKFAKWDRLSNHWEDVGAFDAVSVRALITYSTKVILGGDFSNLGGNATANNLAMYDPATGSFSGIGGGLNGPVNALATDGTNIFVGGVFTDAGGNTVADYVAYWNGTAWINPTLGTPFISSGAVNALTPISIGGYTYLFVGGNFFDGGGNVLADYLSKIKLADGSNTSIGAGSFNAQVRSLVNDGTTVYIGGDFTDASADVDIDGAAKYVSGSVLEMATNGVPGSVDAIAVHSSLPWFGGNFTDTQADPTLDYLIFNNAGTWGMAGTTTPPNGRVSALHSFGGNLFAGGDFTNIDGVVCPRAAQLSSGIWTCMGGGASPGLNNHVSALVATDVNTVYAGGVFTGTGP